MIAEARPRFTGFRDLNISPVLTPYDLQINWDRFLRLALARALPRPVGYFLVVTGRNRRYKRRRSTGQAELPLG